MKNKAILRFLAGILTVFVGIVHSSAQCDCGPLPASSGNSVTITPAQGVSAIQAAINAASGPLTIYLTDGTYSVSGGQINIIKPNITIRSLSGNRDNVIIQGAGMLGGSGYHGISVLNRKATIADLTIRNIDTHGIDINFWYQSGPIDSVLIHNVHVIDCGQQLIKMSYSGNVNQRGDNGIIECSLIEYTTSLPGSNWYTNGIDLHNAHNWIVRDNTVRNIQSGPSSTSDAGPAILFFKGGSNQIVERNLIVNCDEGIFLGNWGDSPNISNTGGIVRNNMVIGHANSRCGIGVVECPDAKIINNTLYSPGGTPWTAEVFAIEVTGSQCTNILVQNNLANEPYYNNSGLAPIPTFVTNNFSVTGAEFVNAVIPNPDLHLVPGSIAINAGTAHSDVIGDYDCSTRPAITDIGADEWFCTPPSSPVVANPTISTCEGDSLVLNASGTGTLNWFSTLSSTTVLGTGSNYSINGITQTDTFFVSSTVGNCESVRSAAIVNVNPLPDPVITLAGLQLSTFSGYSNYQWYFNGTLMPGETTFLINHGNVNGTYSVSVTDNNGCSASSSPFNLNINGISVNEEIQIHLFPNPAVDLLFIEVSEVKQPGSLMIYELSGKIVFTKSISTTLSSIDVSSLTKGTYLLRFCEKTITLVIE